MLKLQGPAGFVLSGASGSGKTWWTYELFKRDQESRKGGDDGLFEKPFDRVILSYKQYQPLYEKFVQLFPSGVVQLCSGVPWDEIDAIDGQDGRQTALLLDDQMSVLANDMRLSDLFTSGRHRLISPFFFVQNLFLQGKAMVDVHRNANYLLCFRQPRDSQMIHIPEARKMASSTLLFPSGFESADVPQV
jgi:hypothetical protein